MSAAPHRYKGKTCLRCGCKRRAVNRGRSAIYFYKMPDWRMWSQNRPLCFPFTDKRRKSMLVTDLGKLTKKYRMSLIALLELMGFIPAPRPEL